MTAFPNYQQMRKRVPIRAWVALRMVTIAAALVLCVSLFFAPRAGLFFFWGVFIPLLPLVFFLAPGLWRNVCPLAAVHQLPRVLGFTRGRSLPAPLRRHGYLVAVALLLGLIPARKVLFNTNGTALAILLLVTLATGFLGGFAFKGKSGWCTTFCPLLPVQRLYGQTPFAVVRNSHCEPCVGCTANCYDFNPRVAQLADLEDEDARRSAYRKLFAGAFPGLVLAFYTVPAGSGWGIATMYGRFGVYVLAGIGALFALDALLPISTHLIVAAFGAAALDLYYWFNVPRLGQKLADAAPWWYVWPARGAVAALTVLWLWRTYAKERRFAEEVAAPEPVQVGAGAAAALGDAAAHDRPEVTIVPDDRRVAVSPGSTLLEIVERAGLPVEAGCRMGICGSDPVCVVSGADALSPVGADERSTLERLGLADSTRMACCARVHGSVSISLSAERAEAPRLVAVAPPAATDVERVVVIGNGIAGVTAADHVRRGHPACQIDLVGRERHHLYNRIAITRLIYGRTAMKGLYLLPDGWYDDHRIGTWLNTHAAEIDRDGGRVLLATGEAVPYDRLILTAGSRSSVPPIEGFGATGTFVLREAEDAMAIRSYVQEHRCRRAVIAGGGLLGLEAAYALHKLGLHVTVLELYDRLLGRQLDERGSAYLRRYLEGLGFEILLTAETAAVEANGRVGHVNLRDGRSAPADLFLVSAGISCNVELAAAAGLEVNRGVVVDDGMRTSDPRVLAAGDAAEHQGRVWGLWPVAVEQAKVAAANALGGDERYDVAVPVTMLKVSGVDLTSVGRFEPEGPDELVIALEDRVESRYRKLVIADGKIVGAILLGYSLEAPGIIAAIKEGMDVEPLLERLQAGDWGVFVDTGTPAATAVTA